MTSPEREVLVPPSFVREILPSLWFPSAVVILTDCGHSHLRPNDGSVRVGQVWDCLLCRDEAERKARRWE